MKHKLVGDRYIIRLDRGEKIAESLVDFCTRNKIILGYFFGIGTASRVDLAHYRLDKKDNHAFSTIEKPLEICSLTGNICLFDGKIALHSHIVVSDEEMHAYGGHLKEAVVAATCEILLMRINAEIDRKFCGDVGLNLLDL